MSVNMNEISLLREYQLIAGVDEVGRGAGFGPVIICITAIDKVFPGRGITDSKLLSMGKRIELDGYIKSQVKEAHFGESTAKEINQKGLSWALRKATERAFEKFINKPEFLIFDGKYPLADLGVPFLVEIKADKNFLAVSSASILAKNYRDEKIIEMSKIYNKWELAKNKGYPTLEHKALVKKHGLSKEHRNNWGWGL